LTLASFLSSFFYSSVSSSYRTPLNGSVVCSSFFSSPLALLFKATAATGAANSSCLI
tara:strand:- start:119 stop:289 length:171 start_codon:yes stop_codon:yes gene_type:complete